MSEREYCAHDITKGTCRDCYDAVVRERDEAVAFASRETQRKIAAWAERDEYATAAQAEAKQVDILTKKCKTLRQLLALARYGLCEVIRNSPDILAKKHCSRILVELDAEEST